MSSYKRKDTASKGSNTQQTVELPYLPVLTQDSYTRILRKSR